MLTLSRYSSVCVRNTTIAGFLSVLERTVFVRYWRHQEKTLFNASAFDIRAIGDVTDSDGQYFCSKNGEPDIRHIIFMMATVTQFDYVKLHNQ